MSFDVQKAFSDYVAGIGLYGSSAPALVEHGSKIHIYYSGSGSDGIWHTTFDGGSGTTVHRINERDVRTAANTSPAAVSYLGNVYVFHSTGGSILHSISFNGTTFTTTNATLGFDVGIFDLGVETSPGATVFNGKIYVFWTGEASGGVFFATFDNAVQDRAKAWSGASRVPPPGILKKSSPHSVVFDDKLYLFWSGSGSDGIWYCTLSKDGSWSTQSSVRDRVPGMALYGSSSPSLVVIADGSVLRLLWVGSDGGVYYSDLNRSSKKWSQQRSMRSEIGSQGLYSGSSPCAIQYDRKPYVLWSGLERALWVSPGFTALEVKTSDWIQPVQWLKEKKYFTMAIKNKPDFNTDLKNRLNGGEQFTSIPATTSSETTTALLKKVIGDYTTERSSEVTTLITITAAIIMGALNNGSAVEISIGDFVMISVVPPS